MTAIRTITLTLESALTRDAQGRVICPRCGAPCEDWSPYDDGVTWHLCEDCDWAVLAEAVECSAPA